MARFQFLPKTQKALAEDERVRAAVMRRKRLSALPGGGLLGMAGLPGALFAIAVASRYDQVLAESANMMPGWLRLGTGWCFLSGAVVSE